MHGQATAASLHPYVHGYKIYCGSMDDFMGCRVGLSADQHRWALYLPYDPVECWHVSVITQVVLWFDICGRCAACPLDVAGCTKYTLPAGWDFKLGVDSPGGDVIYSGMASGTWDQFIAACDATPGCKLLNTWGW